MTKQPKRILLVEDDNFLRRACEASLRKGGFTVVTAENGEKAVEQALAQPPHLVLLDLLLPKMSGIDVLRVLRKTEHTRDIPVFILSNSSREADRVEAERLGVSGYFVKANMSLRELGRHVERILEK